MGMYTQKLILGVVPVKRSFLSMEEAVRQKNKFMSVIRRVKPELVEIVDVDDIAEQGILYEADKVPAVVDKLKKAGIDALFLPFCDLGRNRRQRQWRQPSGCPCWYGEPGMKGPTPLRPEAGTPSAACSQPPR